MNQDLVTTLFDYIDGSLYWRESNRGRKAGQVAGCTDKEGYQVLSYSGKQYRVHRLIWLFHYGTLPPLVDHRDRNVSNNRIENLREARYSQNSQNQKTNRRNQSGYRGVQKIGNRWVARLRIEDGPNKRLGSYITAEEAAHAYDNAAKEHHGEFANLNFKDKT